MSYFNEVTPKAKPNEIPKGQTFTAKFICAGPVGYKDGTYLLKESAIEQMAYGLKGCPVLVGHQDVLDFKDMKEKAIGYVSDVHHCEDSGDWYADFIIFCPKTIKKIEDGELPYVSCAYTAVLEDGCKINNVEYKKVIVGGEMKHLALVKNPRYNGTEVWKNSMDDLIVADGVLYNEKESIMWGIKKSKVELDKETFINTVEGEKTLEELVNMVEEFKKQITELEAKNAELTEKVNSLEAEKPAEEIPSGKPEDTEPAPVEPVAETAPAETDADLKKDLNNALIQEVSVRLVEVPDVNIK